MQSISSNSYMLLDVCLITVLLICRRGYTAKLPEELLSYLQTSQSVLCFVVPFLPPLADYTQHKTFVGICLPCSTPLTQERCYTESSWGYTSPIFWHWLKPVALEDAGRYNCAITEKLDSLGMDYLSLCFAFSHKIPPSFYRKQTDFFFPTSGWKVPIYV